MADQDMPIESAEDTIKRIFSTGDSTVGAEITHEFNRYSRLQEVTFPKPARTRLIAVANQKGGVGKTTSTVNIAAALAKNGARVLVIDMDPQGNCSTALGVRHESGEPSVYDVLEGRMSIAEVKRPCPDFETLDVVPASIDLSGAELEVAQFENRNNLLNEAVQQFLRGSNEHPDSG